MKKRGRLRQCRVRVQKAELIIWQLRSDLLISSQNIQPPVGGFHIRQSIDVIQHTQAGKVCLLHSLHRQPDKGGQMGPRIGHQVGVTDAGNTADEAVASGLVVQPLHQIRAKGCLESTHRRLDILAAYEQIRGGIWELDPDRYSSGRGRVLFSSNGKPFVSVRFSLWHPSNRPAAGELSRWP